MIYESSLKHLRAKRAAKKQGNTSISALEVYMWKACCRGTFLFVLCQMFVYLPLLCISVNKHPPVLQKGLFGGSNSKTWSYCLNISITSCQGKFSNSSFIFSSLIASHSFHAMKPINSIFFCLQVFLVAICMSLTIQHDNGLTTE